MIQTVLGPVPASELGPASTHDHVISDCRILCRPVDGRDPLTLLVNEETREFIRQNALSSMDNLVLDDPELALEELADAQREGLSGFVDVTSWGGDAHYAHLPALSRQSGLHIIAGCGIYLDRPHPAWVTAADDAQLADHFRRTVTDHLPGVTYRAGILGIIGTGAPVTASESRVVAAAGRVAGETGVALSVRLDPAAPDGRAMLDVLAAVGCPASQVLIPNSDELLGAAGATQLLRLQQLAETGATLEFCFGNVFRLREGFPCQGDERRLEALTHLISRGLAHRLVLGQSVWMKIQLRRHGGYGYGHLMRTIVPALQARGVGQAELQQMLVGNPRRLLDRSASVPTHAPRRARTQVSPVPPASHTD